MTNEKEERMRLRRSLHFVPGANEKMMGKALTLGADALIFDLEDSVTPEAKLAARLAQGQYTTAANTANETPRAELLHPGVARYLREIGALR